MTGNLLGVVLCGGKSSRMGTDKGLLPHPSCGLRATRVADIVKEAINGEVVLSVHSDQKMAYERAIPAYRLIEDQGERSGPLVGVEACHGYAPDAALMVVACDLLGITVSFLRDLVKLFNESGLSVVAHGKHGAEPLCACYAPSFLSRMIEEARLTDGSIYRALMTMEYIAYPVKDEKLLKNFNTPEDG